MRTRACVACGLGSADCNRLSPRTVLGRLVCALCRLWGACCAGSDNKVCLAGVPALPGVQRGCCSKQHCHLASRAGVCLFTSTRQPGRPLKQQALSTKVSWRAWALPRGAHQRVARHWLVGSAWDILSRKDRRDQVDAHWPLPDTGRRTPAGARSPGSQASARWRRARPPPMPPPARAGAAAARAAVAPRRCWPPRTCRPGTLLQARAGLRGAQQQRS